MTKTGEVDEFERWLGSNFESPTEDAIHKVINRQQMTPNDWERIIRFTASQYVRTPARLIENMSRWQQQLPEIVEKSLKETVNNLKNGTIPDRTNQSSNNTDRFPGQVKFTPSTEKGTSIIEVNAIAGRGMWLWEMKHLLSSTINELLKHNWCVMTAWPGFRWVTSDDPVICLNYYAPEQYDFKGGWGSKGSEILFPLSPHHLLYTKIGYKKPENRNLNLEMSTKFQKLFIEHAYRWIFAENPIEEIEILRPRTVNKIKFDSEKNEWLRWHDMQSKEEIAFDQ